MKTRLALLLTSAARAKLLQLFALFNEEPLRFREIQRRIGVGSRSLQHELQRLEALDLIARQGRGREVRYRARTETALWLPVWQMIASLARPAEICRILLADLAGVSAAFIYGSIARDDARPDSDVDLCLVADGAEKQYDTATTWLRAVWNLRPKPSFTLIPITPARLLEKQAVGDHFFQTVLTEGVLIAAEN